MDDEDLEEMRAMRGGNINKYGHGSDCADNVIVIVILCGRTA